MGTASGWIVETEAYIGPVDRAAHSFGNRRTKRTEVMFGPPGYAYTYTMHTHYLVNVVSGEIGHPEAVLIRALEPCSGFKLMYHSYRWQIIDIGYGTGAFTQTAIYLCSSHLSDLFTDRVEFK